MVSLDEHEHSYMDSQNIMFSTENPGHQNNAGFSQATSQRPPRGASFNADEDYLLISAWLNTSLDAIHGNEQKEQTFWGKIHDYYHKFKTFDSDRSQLMLSQRWRRLQWKVNKYSGCVAAIYAKNESGKTEQDKIADAKKLYEAQENSKWNLDHAWNLLRHQPKWIQLNQELDTLTLNGKKKSKPHTSTSSSVDTEINIEEEVNPCNPVVRPLGRKSEKRKMKETSDQLVLIEKLHSEKKERDEKKLEIMKEKVEVDKEKLRVRKFEAEMRVMSMDTSIMNDEERAYYSKLRMKILQGNT